MGGCCGDLGAGAGLGFFQGEKERSSEGEKSRFEKKPTSEGTVAERL